MKQGWARFNRYLYKYWKLQVSVILLGFLLVPLGLLNPYLAKLLIDKAYGNKDLKLFLVLAVIGGSIFMLTSIITSYSRYLSQRIKQHVYFDMAKDFFSHLQYLPLSFFINRSTGEHLYRVNADVGSVSGFICGVLPEITLLIPRLLFILVIVFYLHWKMALLAFLLTIASYVHPYFFAKRIKEMTREVKDREQSLYKGLHEIFSHIHLIKAFAKEDEEIKKYEEGLAERIKFDLRRTRLLSIRGLTNSFLNRALTGIVALYGGYELIRGSITLGSLTAITIYLNQFMGLLNSIAGLYQTIVVSSVSRQRLSHLLDTKRVYDTNDAIAYSFKEGSVEFKDIIFGYDKNRPVLKGVTFYIEPASKIALVGPSGCGKTTMLSLILRLYEPERGAIFIDKKDIRNIKFNSLKSQIGIALQEPFLWNDTIANNILYGALNPARKDMVRAARLAEAEDFIMSLPEKYNTVIGERACKISEGQKQRIAIARAFVRNPKILILDEALSSLDSETEDKIIDTIKREFKDSTVIVVSHRLSAVRKMDLVYFIEDGLAVKTGSHSEMLERSAKYRQLFASQVETAFIKAKV